LRRRGGIGLIAGCVPILSGLAALSDNGSQLSYNFFLAPEGRPGSAGADEERGARRCAPRSFFPGARGR
jgi:hypothetical protein